MALLVLAAAAAAEPPSGTPPEETTASTQPSSAPEGAATASAAKSGSSDEAPPVRRYTLPRLLAMARKHSPIVAAAEAQVDVRRAQQSEAIRHWLPTGELNFLFTAAPAVECVAPQGLSPLPGESEKDFRTRNCVNTVNPKTGSNVSYLSTNFAGVAGELNVKLTQPIYTFGKIEHGYAAAKHGVAAEQAKVAAATAEAELNVTKAYWGLKTARASREMASSARDELAKWVKKIDEDLDAEKPKYHFSISDLQRLKVAMAQVDLVLAELDRGVSIAQAGLEAAVGEKVDIDTEELAPVEVETAPLDEYQKDALLHRPEIRALDQGLGAFRELQKLKLSEMLPDLAVVGSITYRFAPTVEDSLSAFVNHANVFGFGAALAIRQPLDLFVRHARYAGARADADAFAAKRQLAVTGIDFEIAQARSNLVEAQRRMGLVNKAQHVAQGWLSAVQQNLDLGTAAPRDLVDAARSYYELRLRYFQSIFDVNLAAAVLRRASGADLAEGLPANDKADQAGQEPSSPAAPHGDPRAQ